MDQEKNCAPELHFRLAEQSEAGTVLALYEAVKGRPFCAWDETYPGPQEIEDDMAAENLFVLESEGAIIGAISINPENEHDDLSCWTIGGPAGEFSRVALLPEFQGRHLAHVLVENVLAVMKSRGLKTVHISVATENLPAQKTYRRLDFRFIDEQEMWGHTFYLCERSL